MRLAEYNCHGSCLGRSMAYNYLGITWTQINGVLRPIHNEQDNFCLGWEHHDIGSFPSCLLCLLLPAQTACGPAQKGQGQGRGTSGIWLCNPTLKTAFIADIAGFSLNPNLDKD